jgi:hypothetical protein
MLPKATTSISAILTALKKPVLLISLPFLTNCATFGVAGESNYFLQSSQIKHLCETTQDAEVLALCQRCGAHIEANRKLSKIVAQGGQIRVETIIANDQNRCVYHVGEILSAN